MPKHVWKLESSGEVDLMAVEWEESDGNGHNGPRCVNCGFDFCDPCDASQTNWNSECLSPTLESLLANIRKI